MVLNSLKVYITVSKSVFRKVLRESCCAIICHDSSGSDKYAAQQNSKYGGQDELIYIKKQMSKIMC